MCICTAVEKAYNQKSDFCYDHQLLNFFEFLFPFMSERKMLTAHFIFSFIVLCMIKPKIWAIEFFNSLIIFFTSR